MGVASTGGNFDATPVDAGSLVATAVALLLTPVAARLAWRIGATAKPSERGLATKETPLLGGLAIFAGVLLAAVIWLPATIKLPHVPHGPPGPGG